MIRYALGGVALAVTGYGLKKYLKDDKNVDRVFNVLNKAEEKSDKFFDNLQEKVDKQFYSNGKPK